MHSIQTKYFIISIGLKLTPNIKRSLCSVPSKNEKLPKEMPMNKFTRLSPATKIAGQNVALRHTLISNGSKRNPLKKTIGTAMHRPLMFWQKLHWADGTSVVFAISWVRYCPHCISKALYFGCCTVFGDESINRLTSRAFGRIGNKEPETNPNIQFYLWS
ncbi:hypothetical protein X798_02861 [Onchocerca flexuosa]|uniref:Uncharacterized protein n=1 Tax=Onchocerca flexuosa TaxID=387005 RepID=A0A238BYX8_9BILA|nr:hypothetical protein X798_02861 [Onchocerca flexuosa]